jgi:hypothetical protein
MSLFRSRYPTIENVIDSMKRCYREVCVQLVTRSRHGFNECAPDIVPLFLSDKYEDNVKGMETIDSAVNDTVKSDSEYVRIKRAGDELVKIIRETESQLTQIHTDQDDSILAHDEECNEIHTHNDEWERLYKEAKKKACDNKSELIRLLTIKETFDRHIVEIRKELLKVAGETPNDQLNLSEKNPDLFLKPKFLQNSQKRIESGFLINYTSLSHRMFKPSTSSVLMTFDGLRKCVVDEIIETVDVDMEDDYKLYGDPLTKLIRLKVSEIIVETTYPMIIGSHTIMDVYLSVRDAILCMLDRLYRTL